MSIQSEIDRLKNVKTAIKNAIVAKGVEVPEGTTFREYADKIATIPSGNRKVTVHFEPTIAGAMGVYGFSINNYLMEIPPMATTFEIELLEGRNMSIHPFNVVCCCNVDEFAINRVTDKNGQELWVSTDLNFSYFEVPEETDEIYLYNH